MQLWGRRLQTRRCLISDLHPSKNIHIGRAPSERSFMGGSLSSSSSSSSSTACPTPAGLRMLRQHRTIVVDPDEHEYYARIDAARASHRSAMRQLGEPSVIESELAESALRARLRSHEPRRWRLSASRFDYELFSWSSAERQLDHLERTLGKIQQPPLAFDDETACTAAREGGAEVYFSIEDFENALLEGTLAVRHCDDKRVVNSLRLDEDDATTTADGPISI